MKHLFVSMFGITLLLLFVYPESSFARSKTKRHFALSEDVTQNLVNDFIAASNSGDRDAMQNFIMEYYDSNALKRIPLFALVSLNMQFYYETGGEGYELLKVLPAEQNLLCAELFNNLTKTRVKLEIPVSAAPGYKINRFIRVKALANAKSGQPDDVCSDDEMVAKLDECLHVMAKDEEFSGTVIVAKNGKVLLQRAIGDASKAYEVANNMDTRFNIASVGKMFTALAVIQLAEQGKLSFDDTLDKFVSKEWLNPEISRKIQIKHLLTHTSGLGDYFRDAYKQCEVPFFRELNNYKSLIADNVLQFEPGTRFSYSNTGMLLLGVIIEKASGMPYFSYLNEHIFQPAGMNSSGGFDKDVPIKNRATGYTKVYENGVAGWNNHQFTRIMRGSPSGGVYSTAPDMLRFDAAIRNQQLLSPAYSKIAMEGRPELNASFHSYGFFVNDGEMGKVISHKGDGRGMNCQYKAYVDLGYTYIVLSNYSAPSANIVANVLDQLINHSNAINK